MPHRPMQPRTMAGDGGIAAQVTTVNGSSVKLQIRLWDLTSFKTIFQHLYLGGSIFGLELEVFERLMSFPIHLTS